MTSFEIAGWQTREDTREEQPEAFFFFRTKR
jgi:hypothetical protein